MRGPVLGIQAKKDENKPVERPETRDEQGTLLAEERSLSVTYSAWLALRQFTRVHALPKAFFTKVEKKNR